MDEIAIEKASRPFGKWILGLLAAGAAIGGGVYGITSLAALRIPTAYLLLAGLGVEIYLAYQFCRRGPGSAPILLLLAGWAFAVGGIAFDMGVTMAKSPDLQLENNPIARAFLDNGYSLSHLRIFAVFAQGGLALLVCLGWLAFLRHRETLLALVWAMGPRGFREFSNAATRGELRPKMLISRSGITLPRLNWYRFTCLAFAAMVGGHLGRWYLGLEWLDLVPPRQPLIMAVTASTGIVYFYLWLWFEYRKGPPRDRLEPNRTSSTTGAAADVLR